MESLEYVPARRVRKIAYSIEQAIAASTFSRSTIFRYIKSGRLKTIVVGGRTMVARDALEQLVLGARSPRSGDDAA